MVFCVGGPRPAREGGGVTALGMSMPSRQILWGNRPAIRFPQTPFHSLLALLAVAGGECVGRWVATGRCLPVGSRQGEHRSAVRQGECTSREEVADYGLLYALRVVAFLRGLLPADGSCSTRRISLNVSFFTARAIRFVGVRSAMT